MDCPRGVDLLMCCLSEPLDGCTELYAPGDSQQHFLTTVGGIISIQCILAPALCIVAVDPANGHLISTILMVSGISTLLQCIIGIRLPIIQGVSFSFISCVVTLFHTQSNCPPIGELFAMGETKRSEEWQGRLTEIQGAVITVAVVQVLLGYSGLIGIFVAIVSPITIAVIMMLAGLSMIETAINMAAGNWYQSLATIVLLVTFSQILRALRTPLVGYTKAKGWHVSWFQGCLQFSVVISTAIVWITSYIFTAINWMEEANPAHPDAQFEAISAAHWFRVPYPFQWGWPRLTLSSTIAVSAAVIVSILESVGCYYTCSSVCGKPPPPSSAVSRGIGVEGIGCFVAGIFGAGPGITSLSENIAAIGSTQVASVRVVMSGAIFMILISFFGKLGAAFASIPPPIAGGLLCVMFSMVTASGLSTLKYVDLQSHRNLLVMGSSIFFGIACPQWLYKNQGTVETEYFNFDQLFVLLLSSKIFVGAVTALLLDNIIPGTRKGRGFWSHHEGESGIHGSNDEHPLLPGARIIKKLGIWITAFVCER